MRLAALALLVLASPALAQYPPEPPLIAPTNALSPADEQKALIVPAGFEVQLVASEPDIQKPMQMAFDARARLWVTTSHHYPFAAPAGKATDKLFVLSDIDPATGKARKVQVFADDLNIPIGILPLPDCKSCIVSSVGEIRKYTDTNGDGKADKMEVLFTGFGTRDTHGMYNSFTLMPDGWVYACHGYLNTSKVKGKDGHEVEMNSGNTFRFRPDGSRIEVYTRGQVNPFGIAIDPWFNLYTADCHTKPITQLIPGAVYDSFGKPHDGLGYAPHVTRHAHGSTALCGLTWYDADQFPKKYLGCMFLGNVVTNRINFDRIEWHGSTPVAIEQPDFLVSKDPWFRPTDIKLGPDGALYVTDFYNKIIGHYEVDLKHPQRDNDHGRVWRIVWKGDGAKPAKMAFGDLTKAKDVELAKLLSSPNLMVRLMASEQACHRGKEMAAALENADGLAESHIPWILFRSGQCTLGELAVSAMMQKNPKQLLPVLKLLASTRSDRSRKVAESLVLFDDNRPGPNAVGINWDQTFRAFVDVIAAYPRAEFVAPLVGLLKDCPADDTHLRHAARIALRNCLRDDEKAWPTGATAADPVIADVALAIPSEKAAAYLLTQVRTKAIPGNKLAAVAEHVARYGTPRDEEGLFRSLDSFRSDPEPAPVLAAFRGIQARGVTLSQRTSEYVLETAFQRIKSADPGDSAQTKELATGLRVLNAFPAVADRTLMARLSVPKSPMVDALERIIAETKLPPQARVDAAEVLLRYSPQGGLLGLRRQLTNTDLPLDFRNRLLLVFASSTNKDARLDARDALKDAPYRTAVAVGTALAGSPAGAEDLLTAVKMGKAPARLLQEKVILERLKAARIPNLDRQIAALTRGLAPLDQKIAALLKKRATAFASAKPDKELGAKLFTKHCAACHKIGEMGGKIAPNLDGVGIRGVERILEDVLDPNRNVDQAFRARIITTKDEQTITGLMLRVEGEVVVVADAEGKEVRVPTKEIATNRETMLSPMPANFGDTIPEADFQHLMAYLLAQRAKEPPKK